MKKCKRCETDKPIDQFSIRSKSKDGRQAWCKACSTANRMNRYREKHSEERQYRAQYQKVNKEYVRKQKESSPCSDCGNFFPYYVMDFDHTGNDKAGNVGEMVKGGRTRLDKEIAKCELVCANCHRIRTHLRQCEVI